MKIFMVEHLMVYSENDEDLKLIGVFFTRESAMNAINELNGKPGFRLAPRIIDPLTEDYISGFYLDELTIDKILWSEGFSTGDL